jgi:methylglutaconyl-CoA hydratase
VFHRRPPGAGDRHAETGRPPAEEVPLTRLVRYAVDRAVATITLDSPDNRNALSAQLMAELAAALGAGVADESVRVIVLTSAGPVFCSGMDLAATRAATAARAERTAGAPGPGADDHGLPVTAFPEILAAIWTAPKPVLARVAGPARAGGIGLIAACDIAVAAQSATFAFTEVRLGVVPAVISVTVLPRLLPRAAQELFLTGDVFDGTRAAEIGLVNVAVPDDDLDAAVQRFVDMLVRAAPGAVAATKALLRRGSDSALADELAAMAELSAWHFASDEGREGMAAFAEKRPPRWVSG